MDESLVLPLDAFVRSIGVNRESPHVFLTGAGASVTSGMPSAERCIWEWKREIFLSNNPGLETQFAEISLPAVREKIQRWIDSRGDFPTAGSAEEYGYLIERCFPVAVDRRAWFQGHVQSARPHVGYRALCALAEAGAVDSNWSTNFDQLTARAAADFNLVPIEVGLRTGDRLPRRIRSGELLCVALHGDYRYDRLRNTSEELQELQRSLRAGLVQRTSDRSLVVVGYSGRDASIMDALREAYTSPGTGGLYWCSYGEEKVPDSVSDLIALARKNGRAAFIVASQGFDDLTSRLALRCLKGESFQEIRSNAIKEIDSALERKAFSAPQVNVGSLIKSNAFEIECPSELYEFDLAEWPKKRAWAWVEEKTAGRPIVAVPFRGRIFCLGTIDAIGEAFQGLVRGRIQRTSINNRDLQFDDGAIVSLLRRALVRAISSACGLETDGRERLIDGAAREQKMHAGKRWGVHESVILYLRRIQDRQYLVIKPSVAVRDSDGNEAPIDIERRIRLEVLGWQHNAKFNQAMERWRSQLFPKDRDRFEFPANSPTPFVFKVRRAPIFAALKTQAGHRGASIPDKVSRYVRHYGFAIEEPRLVFSSKDGSVPAYDVHPIRGIIKNKPYDYAITKRGLAASVRLGVVCPERDSKLVAAFLQGINTHISPADKDRDYLLDYPGFGTAFGCSIEVPSTDCDSWHTYQAPPGDANVQSEALEMARSITAKIDALRASTLPNVVVIYVPDRFERWKRFESDGERFDLHDYVKAYCVPRGITTQFLNEHTLHEDQQCRVRWWLSLALYVKSMRTPWVLDGLDSDTAFVGLGYSIDKAADRGRHVVMGCSHIYNSRGEGLQYRLSKVEDPIIRGKNPFMSRDDARRTGENIRQLFYEARMSLPRRVVVHKRSAFWRDEREGLLEGLGGVDEVDLLEINIEPSLRYLSSIYSQGQFRQDNFPVDRGSVVCLDNQSALLWVHGVAQALNPRFKYYQGKRRIPAPLVVRRHAGKSDLSLIGAEILGLSKMNWNSFDLYTRMPATIESSRYIARIGSLLQRFSANSFDYRLFI